MVLEVRSEGVTMTINFRGSLSSTEWDRVRTMLTDGSTVLFRENDKELTVDGQSSRFGIVSEKVEGGRNVVGTILLTGADDFAYQLRQFFLQVK